MKIRLKIEYCVFSLILMLIIAGVIVRPITYVAFLLSVIVIVFSKNADIVTILFFLFPFATIFKLSPGSGSLFTYLEMLAIAKFLVSKKLSKSIFLGWSFYSLYVVMGMKTAFSDGIKQIILPLLIYYVIKFSQEGNLKKYSEYYIVSMILSSLLGYLQAYIPNLSLFINTKQDHLGYGEYITRFSGLWGDPNYYTVNLILCLVIIIYYQSQKVFSIRKTVSFFVPLVFFGALTGSKTFLLMLAIVAIWMVFVFWKEKRYMLAFSCIMIIIIFVVMLLTNRLPIFDNILTRISITKGDISTGRVGLWVQYNNYFLNHPIKLLFGNGLGNGYTFTAPHSIYIDYLDIYGVIGTVLFLYNVILSVYKYRVKISILNFMPLLFIMIMYATLSMIRYLDFGFQISLALVILFDKKEKVDYGRRKKNCRTMSRI